VAADELLLARDALTWDEAGDEQVDLLRGDGLLDGCDGVVVSDVLEVDAVDFPERMRLEEGRR
jgi:hypothetical protein